MQQAEYPKDAPLLQFLLNCVPTGAGGPTAELPMDGVWTDSCESALQRFAVVATGKPTSSTRLPETLLRKLMAFHPALIDKGSAKTAFVKEVFDPGWCERVPAISPKHCNFQLLAKQTAQCGWGIFAAEPIPARRKVIEFTGERISWPEAKRRGRRWRLDMIRCNPQVVLDPAKGGSGAEFINHSCEPNLRVQRQQGHVLLFSLRPIAKGEQITFDYKLPAGRAEKEPCHCGSKLCRGYL